MSTFELEITGDLHHGVEEVLGHVPATAEPVVVLAAFLDSFAKSYGLSESGAIDDDPVGRLALTGELDALLSDLFGTSGRLTPDLVRQSIYRALTEIASDQSARKLINKARPFSEEEVLVLGQVYWNIEANASRPRLPIRPHLTDDRATQRDIPVPGASGDFATMHWTARANQKCVRKTSGQSFRKQGTRLTVLVAQHVLASRATAVGASIRGELTHHDAAGRLRSILWPSTRPEQPVKPGVLAPSSGRPAAGTRILIGAPADVGAGYQPRWVDHQIGHHWAESPERRVWLTGGPGLGKSFTARRVMQSAIADHGKENETLLVWVDSATVTSVQEALAATGEALRAHGLMTPAARSTSTDQEARAVLAALATSTWRWLVVYDNAEPDELLAAHLVPSGANPHGRALVTTTSRSPRMGTHGTVLEAELFTPDEAESFLTDGVHGRNRGELPLARVSRSDRTALARAVGYHPLALAVAAATIVSNALEIQEWVSEFRATGAMDEAADEPDQGGYPHLITATWTTALAHAGRDLPAGLVERAALVAALQDPDGHPTWVWDSEEVAAWVAGGHTLERRHRIPVAVQRLIDHSILELRGTRWNDARLATHQLAARAVRESAGPAAAAELAAILADEWLRRLTIAEPHPRALLATVDVLDTVAGLPPHARHVVHALTAFADRPSLQTAVSSVGRVRRLAPALLHGGAVGRARWAALWSDASDEVEQSDVDETMLASHGLETPRVMRLAVTDVLEALVTDPELEDPLRAQYLAQLAHVQDTTGHDVLAESNRHKAVALYETWIGSGTEHEASALAALSSLYDAIGAPDRTATLSALVDTQVAREDTTQAAQDAAGALAASDRWWDLAMLLSGQGRRAEAKDLLRRSLGVIDDHPQLRGRARRASTALARLHADDREWAEAESCLGAAMITMFDHSIRTRVLLASVQLHRGRTPESYATVAHPDLARRATGQETHPPDPHAQDSLDAVDRVIERLELQATAAAATHVHRWRDAASLYGAVLDHVEVHPDVDPWAQEREVSGLHLMIAVCRSGAGDPQGAVDHLEQSIGITDVLVTSDPDDHTARDEMARGLALLCVALGTLERWDEAIEVATRSVVMHEATVERDPWDPAATSDLAQSLTSLVWALYQGGRLHELVEPARRTVAVLDAVLDIHSGHRGHRLDLVRALVLLAAGYDHAHDEENARACLLRIVEVYETLLDAEPGMHDVAFAGFLTDLVTDLDRTGHPLATRLRARAEEIERRLNDEGPH